MTIGYIHIRPGQTYSKENGLTGTPEPRGGTTVAYRIDSSGFVDYAVALCSHRDSYNRKTGRQISSRRLGLNRKHSGSIRLIGDETAPAAIISWLTECGVL